MNLFPKQFVESEIALLMNNLDPLLYELRGAWPMKWQFDFGTETGKLKQVARELVGQDCIITGSCKHSTVIEAAWKPLHHQMEWIVRYCKVTCCIHVTLLVFIVAPWC